MQSAICLEIQGSATTAHLGFPLKLVTPTGKLFCRATDEAHAHRLIRALKEDQARQQGHTI